MIKRGGGRAAAGTAQKHGAAERACKSGGTGHGGNAFCFRKVEENSDYVGKDFATEARAMHLGETPERSIYGEARLEEAKELIEEGIPVAPLPFMPFMPNRKTN